MVDDHSSDATGDLAKAAGADVVRNTVNMGYDGALNEGFKRANKQGAEIIVTFDADGQHEPSILPDFISPIRNGDVDLVLGQRQKSARISEMLFNAYTRSRFGIGDILCGLKAYNMNLYCHHGRFDGHRSIGTELALASAKRGVPLKSVKVPIYNREDAPRMGTALRANANILRALIIALKADLFGWRST